MLYVTTRGTQDAFTAYRTTHQDRGPDGGFFVPMQMPVFSQGDVLKLPQNSFGQNIAVILNLFFGTKITAWDVDVAIGRRGFTTKTAGHRILMGQLWHDSDGGFQWALHSLAKLVSPDLPAGTPLPNWLEIGIRIAVVFAVIGDLMATGKVSREKGIDVAVATGSFAMPIALWYARQMGLPIRNLICGCNENGVVWDLLHRGEANTGVLAVKTTTPEADFAIPPNFERLVHATLGQEEALHYWWSCTEGRTYTLAEVDMITLSKGTFAAVVSMDRVASIIPSVYRTNRYVLDPYGALAYGALSDYRARTGSVGLALILTEKGPICEAASVAKTMNISPEELRHILAKS